MDKNATELNISQVNINNLVEQILKRVRPIAKTRSIEIIFESFRPVTADVDETKLSLAVTNLVENGVKYNTNSFDRTIVCGTYIDGDSIPDPSGKNK